MFTISTCCFQERAKKEHRDKLGERDDTIPPEYRHLLDQGDKVHKATAQSAGFAVLLKRKPFLL